MTPDQQIWKDAANRASDLSAQAESQYPKNEGHVHDLESDGWPDRSCQVAVYIQRPDKRTKRGWRLHRIATIGQARPAR